MRRNSPVLPGSSRAQAANPVVARQQAVNYAQQQGQVLNQQIDQQTTQMEQRNSGGGCGFLGLGCVAHWVKENRGTIASVFAIGVCLSGLGTAFCGAALAGAYVVRAQQRIATYGFSRSLDANAADALMTVAFAIPMAGAAITGAESAGLSSSGGLILNGVSTIPDAVQFAGGFAPDRDQVFFNGGTLNW